MVSFSAVSGRPVRGSNRSISSPAGRSAANPPHAAAAVDRWDRQTDVHRSVT